MGISQQTADSVRIRLARTRQDVEAAQHLRYIVFYEEYGAVPTTEMVALRRDFDSYDDAADHLIVVDETIPDPDQRIIGTYRLLRQDVAERMGRFYTSSEFDISRLIKPGRPLLELGRSCVLAKYRTRPVLQLLWQGITDYMLDHDISLMFGCASLYGTDTETLATPLSYLYHYHLAPAGYRPRALASRYIEMNLLPKDQINPKTAFAMLPPLIKGYLRVGASIGDGAVVDAQFNTTDVCVVMPVNQVAARYRKHYSRKVNRPIPYGDDTAGDDLSMLAAQSGI